MAVEIIQFLMGKFVDDLAENDHETLPFVVQFREIGKDLEKKVTPSMPLGTTDLLRESLYDLNDILTECQMLSRKHKEGKQSMCMNCYSLHEAWFLHKTRKRLKVIKQRIRTVSDPNPGGLFDGEMGALRGVEFDRWTSQAVDMSKVHGLSDQLVKVERLLVEQDDSAFKGIGIVGMGGVGKTVLAQVLFKSQRVRKRFFPRLWVCTSQTLSKGKDLKREILERMLMSLGVDEEVISSISHDKSRSNILAELVFTLHLQLLGKRYLIVFDDVWNIDEWYGDLNSEIPTDDRWADRLAFGLPKGSGGAVIITSRLKEVATKMVGGEHLYHLQPLTDRESCWAIFMDALARERDMLDHPIVSSMKSEILDRCNGLPLAAKTLGQIMCESFSQSSDSNRETNPSSGSSASVSGSLE